VRVGRGNSAVQKLVSDEQKDTEQPTSRRVWQRRRGQGCRQSKKCMGTRQSSGDTALVKREVSGGQQHRAHRAAVYLVPVRGRGWVLCSAMALVWSGDLGLASPQFRAGLAHLVHSRPSLVGQISMFDLDPESSLVTKVHYQSAKACFKSQTDPCLDFWCPDRTSEVQTTLLGP
jgi:hypothetical protein